MNKKIILPFVVLMVLAMVGAASAITTADDVKVRGTIVEANATGWLVEAGGALNQSTYTWSPYNYAAFWYDLDDDLKSEYLKINTTLSGDYRTIDEDCLIYNTSPQVQDYEYKKDVGPLGKVSGNNVTNYSVEGWMAEKYVAISTGGSVNANANKIVKLLVEFESSSDKKTMATEEAWDLGGGFTLTAKQIDLQGNKVWLSLAKNDKEIDDAVIDTSASGDRRYMYTKDMSGVKDVVLFFCSVDAVFRGTESNLVQVKYVFLIDDDVEKIETSTSYGNMEVKTASATQVILKNDGAIDLSQNTDVEIMKDMYFKVADNSTVRFYPYKVYTEPGDYNVRGTIVEACSVSNANIRVAGATGCPATPGYVWDPYNYAAFWYDVDDDLKSEYLYINASLTSSGRTIEEDDLIYNTSPQVQDYEYKKDVGPLGKVSGNNVTNYSVEGWMAEKYVAISTGGSVNANANKIVKLLVEFESSSDKKTMATEEAWDLGGGFTLTAKQIDLQGNKVWLSLAKNDKEIDDAVIDTSASGDRRYMYTKDMSGVKDVVLFFCSVDAVFRGTESNLVQVKYVFLIDDDVEKIETSTSYGNMEVKTASATQVILKNDGAIDLSQNADVEIMKDMYFKVADNYMVRFYPFVKRTINGTVPTPPETIPADDVDGDGVPDVWDADNSTLPGYWTDSDGIGRKWGDMNGDGKLTSVDALMILQAAAEKIDIG